MEEERRFVSGQWGAEDTIGKHSRSCLDFSFKMPNFTFDHKRIVGAEEAIEHMLM